VLWRHVLRNALLPTITVVATQTGYLIGGLLVVEVLFHYQGIAVSSTTPPRQGLPDVGIRDPHHRLIYTLATLLADIVYSALNPRIHFGERMSVEATLRPAPSARSTRPSRPPRGASGSACCSARRPS